MTSSIKYSISVNQGKKMTELVVRFEIILLTHETNSSRDYVPALIFLPAVHQVHMSHNMLSGMDLLTRLRGTLLPKKKAKSSSQFSCKGEDTIIFHGRYSFSDN